MRKVFRLSLIVGLVLYLVARLKLAHDQLSIETEEGKFWHRMARVWKAYAALSEAVREPRTFGNPGWEKMFELRLEALGKALNRMSFLLYSDELLNCRRSWEAAKDDLLALNTLQEQRQKKGMQGQLYEMWDALASMDSIGEARRVEMALR